jgi:acetyl esterase/lipase
MMHGTADAPADGGWARGAIERARAFELALRQAGRPVDVKYYERGKHNGIFTDRGRTAMLWIAWQRLFARDSRFQLRALTKR